jgi:Divergent InlB B-repeat domain
MRRRGTVVLLAVMAVAGLASAFAIFAGVGSAASAEKPVNVTPPTITGTPQEGETLSGDPGEWTNSNGYNFFWLRCDPNGGSCENIGGSPQAEAVVGRGPTYLLMTADVGHTLRFMVIAGNFDGSETSTSVPTALIQKAAAPTTTTTTTTPPPATRIKLTVKKSGGGTVNSRPVGISCGKRCSSGFVRGGVVTLSARPAAGWKSVRWSGACKGTKPVCRLSLRSASTVTALFARR